MSAAGFGNNDMQTVGLAVIIMAAALISLWNLSSRKDLQLFGEIVHRVETDHKVVALTFDDGPTSGFTQQILEILRDHDVKATFYLVGQAMAAHPVEAQMIADAGHEIGNHSYTHSRMLFMSPARVAAELDETNRLIRGLGYRHDIHFRPPYGKKLLILPYELRKRDMLSVTWDVAPERWGQTPESSAVVAQRAITQTRPGSIILLHVMYPPMEASLQAVPQIIRQLKARGYRFVTVNELLAFRSNEIN